MALKAQIFSPLQKKFLTPGVEERALKDMESVLGLNHISSSY